MARPLRIEYEGAVYHITARGNEKRSIFKDNKDRFIFLDILNKAKEKYNWLCHAYCLMNNHYHLIIETIDANLSIGMRQLNGVYSQAFNNRHKRAGHFFQGRYNSIIIEKNAYLLEASRYVVLNPVRAKIVKHPQEWKWSSYRSMVGIEKPLKLLTTDWVLSEFSKNKKKAQQLYQDFILEGLGDSIYSKIKYRNILGSPEFIKKLKKYTQDKEDVKEIIRKERYIDRPSLESLFSKKILEAKEARNKQIAAAVYNYGYRQIEIANYLNMNYATISRLVKKQKV